MPIYEFKCPNDHGLFQTFLNDPPSDEDMEMGAYTCPDCNAVLKRKFSMFSANVGMPDHYNMAVGQYVNSERELKDHFKAASEEATLRTGEEHRFVPHDPREAKDALGVTDEGLEETHRRAHDTGESSHTPRGPEYGRAGTVPEARPRQREEARWL